MKDMTEEQIKEIALANKEKIERLVSIGVLSMNQDETRSYNIGQSDYSTKVIQPWSVWMDWELNPWDADIVKRIARHKEGERREMDYAKIIHICKERLRQLGNE